MDHHTEIFVGIDVPKARNAIAVADGESGGEVRFLGEVDSSAESMRRVVWRLAAKHEQVHFCYEAGPTGYGLYRLITLLGHPCTVVAPSLIPRKAGDRVKTNRRDEVGIAKLLRAGELTPVWVPDEGHEAMRDLVRARAAAAETQRVHWQQVSAFMLKLGRIYPRKKSWSMRYLRWLQEQRFDHPAQQIAVQELVEAVRVAKERIARIEAAIEEFVRSWSLGPVARVCSAARRRPHRRRDVRVGDRRYAPVQAGEPPSDALWPASPTPPVRSEQPGRTLGTAVANPRIRA